MNSDYIKTNDEIESFKLGIVITRNVTINGNGHTIDANNSGRILDFKGCNVVLKNINFVNANFNSYGIAVRTRDCGTTIISNCTFANNIGYAAGAVHCYGGTCFIDDCNFVNNNATGDSGGALLIEKCEAQVSNCNFTGNTAINGGGALWWNIGDGIISNCNFVENNAKWGGAAIFTGSGHNYNVSNCNFVRNTADTGSGAVFASKTDNARFLYCDFVGNRVNGNGGAMTNGYAIFCNFIANHADEKGGALYLSNMSKCTFSYNTAGNGSDTYNTTIVKLDTQISSSAVTTVYNGGKYLTITLKDSFGNSISGVKVSVVLNGKTFTPTTDKNGQAKVSTDGFAPKAYTAAITFAENGDYLKSTKSVKVTVKKATPKLTAAKKTFKKSVKTKKYTITLKTNQNKAMKNTKVYIKVNKKTYAAKTNSKGKATFKITKLTKKGKFSATITFKGNAYYNKVTKKATITVK